MTTGKEALLAILVEHNRRERRRGHPAIENAEKRFTALLDPLPEQAAALTAAAARREYAPGMIELDLTADPVRGLISYAFLMMDGTQEEKRRFYEAARPVMADLVPKAGCYSLPQNRILNALVTAQQLPGACVSVGSGKKEVLVSRPGPLPTTALMLHDALLIELRRIGDPKATTALPLAEYARMRGTSVHTRLRDQVLRDLKLLSRVGVTYYERGEWTGVQQLYGGTARLYRGRILYNLSGPIAEGLLNQTMGYAEETLKCDPRGSGYYFSRYLDLDRKRNPGALRRVLVSTLARQSPILPLPGEARRFGEDFKKPFFRDLDKLRFSYELLTFSGDPITPGKLTAEDVQKGAYLIFSESPKSEKIEGPKQNNRGQKPP